MPNLQQITPANAMAFKAVRLAALKDSPTAFGSTHARESQLTDADWLHRAADWSTDRSIAYLALDPTTPCGIAACFLDKENPQSAHLISMWVAPTHRRRGIGQSLINAIDSWASSKRAQTLKLMVTSSNTSAFDFYKQLGFTPTGHTEPYPNDPALIEFEMSRSIAADRAGRFRESLNDVSTPHSKTLKRLSE